MTSDATPLPWRSAALTKEQRSGFFSHLTNAVAGLRANYASFTIAQPEDQLKAPVGSLVRAAGVAADLNITYRTEVRIDGIAGRPDLGIESDQLPVGSVELKAPGLGADPRRFRDKHSRDQWTRFQAIPNLIYTDGTQWSLFRSGVLARSRVDLKVDLLDPTGVQADEESMTALLDLLLDFLDWAPTVPSSPKALAQALAPVTRLLRNEVLADVEANGILRKLMGEWQTTLFPDVDEAGFADGYAQTFTYALLLARLEGATSPLSAESAASELDADHALLAQSLRVLGQPAVRTAIALPAGLLERLIDAVDATRLGKHKDPWLYFYEDFLAAYDPVQRNNRGVYYTPIELVRYMVGATDRALRDHLGRVDGFGDPSVVTLDPAAGTGTFPLAALELAVANATHWGGPGFAAEVATQVAENLYAFEFLVGPYAVTHLRLSRAVAEAGGSPPAKGVNVLLTDTLTEGVSSDAGATIPIFEQRLVEEQIRASVVKSAATPVTVVIGNPPYDRDTTGSGAAARRKGGMVRYGATPGSTGLLSTFLDRLDTTTRAQQSLQLYNDFVYFWRWGIWKATEQHLGNSIVCFVTASSYLTGPAFGGLRATLRERFTHIWITDLGGDSRAAARGDENVFEGIRTPVAVALCVRRDDRVGQDPEIRFRSLRGSRASKFETLASLDEEWTLLPAPPDPLAPLTPDSGTEYATWTPITDVFPWTARGIQFSRSWPVAETAELARKRWDMLVAAPKAERLALLKKSRDADPAREYGSFNTQGLRLPAIAKLTPGAEPDGVRRIGFRAFDEQWCVADARVIDMPRPALWLTADEEQVFFTTVDAETTEGPALIAHRAVPDLNGTNNRGGIVLPKRRGAKGANVNPELVKRLSEVYGSPVTPEEIIAYVFALTGTAAFAERLREDIAQDGVRIPFTENEALFRRAAVAGDVLLRGLTGGTRKLLEGGSSPALPAVARATAPIQPAGAAFPAEFSYQSSTETLTVGAGTIEGVSEEVWAFAVSGYAVLERWLGYRMRDRAGKATSDLDKLRPTTWSLTKELLDLINTIAYVRSVEPEHAALLGEVIDSNLIDPHTIASPDAAARVAPTAQDSAELDMQA